MTGRDTCVLSLSSCRMTMAEALAPDLFSEQELTCSICLDLFDEPVSTPCGHNFCQVMSTSTGQRSKVKGHKSDNDTEG